MTQLIDIEDRDSTATSIAAAGEKAILLTSKNDYSGYQIWCADLSTGAVTEALSTNGYLLGVDGNDRGEAWVSSGWGWASNLDLDPGILIYDIATCEELTAGSPLSTSLAPYDVAFY